jgi:hypothetical protein
VTNKVVFIDKNGVWIGEQGSKELELISQHVITKNKEGKPGKMPAQTLVVIVDRWKQETAADGAKSEENFARKQNIDNPVLKSNLQYTGRHRKLLPSEAYQVRQGICPNCLARSALKQLDTFKKCVNCMARIWTNKQSEMEMAH